MRSVTMFSICLSISVTRSEELAFTSAVVTEGSAASMISPACLAIDISSSWTSNRLIFSSKFRRYASSKVAGLSSGHSLADVTELGDESSVGVLNADLDVGVAEEDILASFGLRNAAEGNALLSL